jgi:outer membrane protein
MKNRIPLMVLLCIPFVLLPRYGAAEEPLTLEASIDIALKNSNTLHAAREGVDIAVAQKREAVTGFLPKFNTTYNYSRLNEAPYSRFQGLPPGPLFPLNGMEIPVGTKDNYNWSIEARQPLFTGGGLIANYQVSKIGEAVARIEETAKVQDVIQNVKIAYFDVLRAQRLLAAAQQGVEMLQAHANLAQNFFSVGLIPKNDMLQAEVELANGKQTQVRMQNEVYLSKSRLNTILKREIFQPVDIVDILDYQPINESFEECLEIAKKNRPEIKIADLRTDQARTMVRAAQSEYFPTVSVVGNYTRFGDNPSVSGSDYKDAENWYVMGVASWNFWEWGKTKYRVDAGKARENQAADQAKELSDQIIMEIKNAYLLLQESESQIAVSRKVIEQTEENYRISEERYKERVARSTEVLDARTLLTRAQAAYANALGDYNIAYTRLQRAMGIIDQSMRK